MERSSLLPFRDFLDVRYGDDMRRYLQAMRECHCAVLDPEEYGAITSMPPRKDFSDVRFNDCDPPVTVYALA